MVISDNLVDKATGTEFRKGGQEIGSSMAEKSRGLFSADDWQCKTYVFIINVFFCVAI